MRIAGIDYGRQLPKGRGIVVSDQMVTSDPDILAVEICNEPGHSEYELTLAYINTMARAIRATRGAK